MPISHEIFTQENIYIHMQFCDSKIKYKQADDLLAVALLELTHSKQPRYEIQPLVCM